jgi:VanZ family protein
MKRIIYIGLSVIMTGLIFGLSAQSASTSSELSSGLTAFLYRGIDALSIPLSYDTFHWIVRKFAHVIEFMLLGYFYSSAALPNRKWLVIVVVLGLVVALTDETIQRFFEGRGPSIFDAFVFDFSGFLIGGFLTLKINKIKLKFNIS